MVLLLIVWTTQLKQQPAVKGQVSIQHAKDLCDDMTYHLVLITSTMTRRGLFQVGMGGFLLCTEGMGDPPPTEPPRQDGKISA